MWTFLTRTLSTQIQCIYVACDRPLLSFSLFFCKKLFFPPLWREIPQKIFNHKNESKTKTFQEEERRKKREERREKREDLHSTAAAAAADRAREANEPAEAVSVSVLGGVRHYVELSLDYAERHS